MTSPSAAYRRRPRYVAGIEMPRELDGRTLRARRFRALVRAYAAELGQLTESDKGLIAQAAALAVHVEQLQADIVAGRVVNEDMVIRLSSEHRRLMTGLRARAAKAKPMAPTILDFAAELAAETEAEADEASEGVAS